MKPTPQQIAAQTRQKAAQRRYEPIIAAWRASGKTLTNRELAEQFDVHKDVVQRAIASTGERRRGKGGGRKRRAPGGSSQSTPAAEPSSGSSQQLTLGASATPPGPGDAQAAFGAWEDQLEQQHPPDAEEAFHAGWRAREEATDLGLLAADSLAWLAREAQLAAQDDTNEGRATARALHRDVLAGVDKAARHRPAAKSAEHLVDPASFPEEAHATAAKLRRTVSRLQAERAEKVQQQLGTATERGGEYLEGTTDTLRVTGDLPGDGGDDEGL
jgi:hypothetical protein